MKQSLEDIKILLLDIEGTVCPISFVKDTLFPYALKALPEILPNQWNSPEFQPYKTAFPESTQASPEAFLTHVEDLTKRDVKVAYLKNLQGYLWETGYKTCAYSTPLFADVLPALHYFLSHRLDRPTDVDQASRTRDHEIRTEPTTNVHKSRRIAIYSSGSVFAQKLLFAHVQTSSSSSSTHGTEDKHDTIHPKTQDITSLISSWYDTTNAGPKTDPQSYTTITTDLGSSSSSAPSATVTTNAQQILFLSDNPLEIQAALTSGMKAILVDRPGNHPLTEQNRTNYEIITSFEQLPF